MKRERLVAVDVFRGITVAAMLLVNNPGDFAHVFGTLKHSVWHGCTLADLVFPFFLFAVGITTQFAVQRRDSENAPQAWAIVRRALLLFVIGLLLNAWPFFEKSQVAGPSWLPTAVGHVIARFADVRIMGVLQRIALAFLLSALIVRRASTRALCAVIVTMLLGYWAALTLLPVPGEGAIGAQLIDQPARTLAAWVDRVTLDWTSRGLGWHMWDRSVPYDPEGLLSTLPATASVLIGVLAARWLTSARAWNEHLRGLALAGVVGVVVGLAWGMLFPINKSLWTSSYVVFTGGVAALTLALIAAATRGRESAPATRVALVFGTNALVAYAGSEFLATVFRSSLKWKVDGHRVGTEFAVSHWLQAQGVEPRVASLLWALGFVALWYVLLKRLHDRGVMVRV